MHDLVNGLYRFGGGLLLWLNVIYLVKHKEFRGSASFATIYFTAGSAWSLLYYWHLHQVESIWGELNVFVPSVVWLILLNHYRRLTRERERQASERDALQRSRDRAVGRHPSMEPRLSRRQRR